MAHDLSPFLAAWEDFAALSQAAQDAGTQATCHLKVDTGMSRLGVEADQALDLLERAAALPGLKIQGLASHLATSGVPGDPTAQKQAEIFSSLLGEARRRGHALTESSLEASGGVMAPPRPRRSRRGWPGWASASTAACPPRKAKGPRPSRGPCASPAA